MILNAPLISSFNILPTFESEYSVELSYATSNSSCTPTCSPSPSLSKSSASPKILYDYIDRKTYILCFECNYPLSYAKSIVSQIKERRVFDLPCQVCNSTATGYHYNVASCNGCKTFFRRCVLSGCSFRCIRSDSNCLSNMRAVKGSRIKCRSCRLDRCLQQGMRREAVTSGTIGPDANSPADAYLKSLSQPSTSDAVQKINEHARSLRTVLRQIHLFRRCDIRFDVINQQINALLESPSFLDNLANYRVTDKDFLFRRDLPEWLTMDLVCSIEFIKRLPELSKFDNHDKEELIRTSGFTIALAIEAIDCYLDGDHKIIMPDGTDLIENMIASAIPVDPEYKKMFVTVLDPLHREKFTIDELALSLQVLFFTMASPSILSPAGKEQLDSTIKNAMENLLSFLIIKDKTTFCVRYGSLIALNESFINVTHLHKQKMKEAERHRLKNHDLLIEQCVFNYRSST